MTGRDRKEEEEARTRARMSNLVLTFETDLWDQILCWPFPLEEAARTPISKRLHDFASDEPVRICKLVQVCKTFYNRYRVRNRDNWIECKFLSHGDFHHEPTGCFPWLDDPNRVYAPPPPCISRQFDFKSKYGDMIAVVLRNISVDVRTRMATARTGFHNNASPWPDETRYRRYLQRQISLKFDASLDEAFVFVSKDGLKTEEGQIVGTNLAFGTFLRSGINHFGFPRDEGEEKCRAKGFRIVRSEVEILAGRIGHSTNLQRVPTLPNGPEQYTDVYWAPHTANLYLDIKVPGGKALFKGQINMQSLGLYSGRALAAWVGAMTKRRDGSIEPQRRVGYVVWEELQFVVDQVCPNLPNVRVFMPPTTKSMRTAVAPSKQGRPCVPNFDEEDDE